MTYQLPTDTRATRFETKQYELFGRRIGSGINRRGAVVGAVVAAPWVSVLALVGVPLWTSTGPLLYAAVPFFVTYRALQRDESGRPAMMRWYDRVLARMPRRRRVLRNPLLPAELFRPRRPLRIAAVTLLVPGGAR